MRYYKQYLLLFLFCSLPGYLLAQGFAGASLADKTLNILTDNLDSFRNIKIIDQFITHHNTNVFSKKSWNSFEFKKDDSLDHMQSLIASGLRTDNEDKKYSYYLATDKKIKRHKYDLIVTLSDTITEGTGYAIHVFLHSFASWYTARIVFNYDKQGQLITCYYTQYNKRIKDLKTEKEVEAFIRNNTYYSTFSLKKPDNYWPVLNPTTQFTDTFSRYFIINLDNNGSTALVFQGFLDQHNDISGIFVDNDKENIDYSLDHGFIYTCRLVTVLHVKDTPWVVVRNLYKRQTKTLGKNDTLTYLYHAFIGYNSHPAHHNIEGVSYYTSGSYWEYPTYSINIKSNRKALYKVRRYCSIPKGTYKGAVDTSDYRRIVTLLNYIDFEKLNNSYDARMSDLPFCKLVITYDDGKTKTVSDYGKQGTYGLMRLYSLLDDLSNSQHWHRRHFLFIGR